MDAPNAEQLLNHSAWIRSLARRLVGDDADDLVQDTWVAALRAKPELGRPLRPWLGTVLRNLACNRRRDARSIVDAAPVEVETSSTEELVERAELSRALVGHVIGLDEPYRRTLLLRFYEGLTPAQIAERDRVSGATVRSRLKRGIAKLREQLDRSVNGGRAQWLAAFLPLATPTRHAAPVAQAGGSAGVASIALGLLTMKTVSVLAGSAAVIGVSIFAWMKLADDPAAAERPIVSGETAEPQLVGDGAREVELAAPNVATFPRTAQSSAAVADTSVVVGRLVDAATDEPLAHFPVGLCRGPAPPTVEWREEMSSVEEELVTDADGRFATSGAYAAGTLHLELLEDWDRREFLTRVIGGPNARTPLQFEHTPGEPGDSSDRESLEVASGPTYYVACDRAEQLGEDAVFTMLTQGPRRFELTWEASRLWVDPAPFTRFLPLDRDLKRSESPHLHVLSNDGAWAGSAPVQTLRGIQPEPVAIVMQPVGAIHGRLVDAGGELVIEARVSLYEGTLEESELAVLTPIYDSMIVPNMSRGRFFYRYLPVGEYTLRVLSEAHPTLVEPLTIVQGDTREDFVLGPSTVSATFRIEGEVVCSSGGRYPRPLAAQLERQESEVNGWRFTDVEWEKKATSWVGRFAFEGLTDDEYRVIVTLGLREPRDSSSPRFEPRSRITRPTGEVLRFELLDDEPTADVIVDVRDRKTGEPIERFHAVLASMKKGVGTETAEGEAGHAKFPGVVSPAGTRVLVAADGYAPAFVELRAPTSEGAYRVAIELSRGWGAVITSVVSKDGEYDLQPGADVYADGMHVATTDDVGIAVLSLPQAPDTLRITVAGLKLIEARGFDATNGKLDDAQDEPFRGFFAAFARD